MSKLFLSASAYSTPGSNSTMLVISVTDESGAPVTNVKKSWISASTLVPFLSGFVNLSIQDFASGANGFYSMTLKADPQKRVAFPFPGLPLTISVRKIILARSGGSGVVAEGYITIPISG
jgi:hypothetical protein